MTKILERVSAIADLTKNVAIIAGILVGGIYLLNPESRIWVRENIYRESAWFYLGWWNLKKRDYCIQDEQFKDKCTRNFYFKSGYSPANGSFPRGSVLMNEAVVQGSESPGLVDDDLKGSKRPRALTVLMPFKCIYILETKSVPILEDVGREGLKTQYRRGIWARAIPDVCQSPTRL